MRDLIQLDNVSQIIEMQKWTAAHARNRSVKNIALPNVRIAFSGNGDVHEEYMDCTYNFDTETIHIQTPFYQYDVYAEDKDRGSVDLTVSNLRAKNRIYEDWLFEVSDVLVNGDTGKADYIRWQIPVLFYVIIQNYMMYHSLDAVFDVEEKIAKQQLGYRNRKGRKKPAVRLYKCYTLKKDWKSAPRLKKPVRYLCPAWGVRGHFRHLKDGREIYVHPCIKGKDRSKYIGKEYKLLKHERNSA